MAGVAPGTPDALPPGTDEAPATRTMLQAPHDIVVAPDGSLYFAEWRSIRRISDGTISTVWSGADETLVGGLTWDGTALAWLVVSNAFTDVPDTQLLRAPVENPSAVQVVMTLPWFHGTALVKDPAPASDRFYVVEATRGFVPGPRPGCQVVLADPGTGTATRKLGTGDGCWVSGSQDLSTTPLPGPEVTLDLPEDAVGMAATTTDELLLVSSGMSAMVLALNITPSTVTLRGIPVPVDHALAVVEGRHGEHPPGPVGASPMALSTCFISGLAPVAGELAFVTDCTGPERYNGALLLADLALDGASAGATARVSRDQTTFTYGEFPTENATVGEVSIPRQSRGL
jgi:hypothetical protein